MARNYADEIDAVKDDIGALRSDIEKLLKTLAKDAKAKSQETMNAARENINEYAHAAKERTKEGVAITEKKIEENPFTSVAAAFGVGLILGRIMSK